MQEAAGIRAERYGRGYEAPPPDAPPAPLRIELNELLSAAERVISLIPEPTLHRVVPRPLDVEGATERISTLLSEREHFSWADIVGDRPSIVELLSAFIALLEQAKRGSLTISQHEPFGPMVIRRESPREAA
jgi:chromatin segregation and condensation protein Rec8/ScpA/Scc1 (kleisin family)